MHQQTHRCPHLACTLQMLTEHLQLLPKFCSYFTHPSSSYLLHIILRLCQNMLFLRNPLKFQIFHKQTCHFLKAYSRLNSKNPCWFLSKSPRYETDSKYIFFSSVVRELLSDLSVPFVTSRDTDL